MGNACRRAEPCRRRAVHPHARGERPAWGKIMQMGGGSSPRPWGTPRQSHGGRGRLRFIPTPVGNASAIGLPVLADHGSSPRPWGTQQRRTAGHGQRRFIPTPVGNAWCDGGPGRPPPVHPHARGERGLAEIAREGVRGSSPRPWGTPGFSPHQGIASRFIPTPVGNAPPTWP